MDFRTLRLAFLVTFAATAAACDGGPSDSNPPTSDPGVRVSAGAQVTDTIGVAPTQALVVQVTGPNGRPASNAVVRFESVLVGTGFDETPTVWVAREGTSAFAYAVTDTTDTEGRASVRVLLGGRAGPGGVKVMVPAHGYETTAPYTIQPGAPAAITAAPADTMVYVGRSVEMRATVTDRAGNPRADAATFTVASGPATLSGGRTLTTTGIGRGVVVAQVAGLADTVHVSAVPEGTVAGYTGDMDLYTVNLDGTGLTLLAQGSAGRGYFGEMPAAWSADGKSLVYHDPRGDHTRLLYSMDLATGARTRLISGPDGLISEAWPQRSRDGQWIYFNGVGFWQGVYTPTHPFRVRSDGTGMERIETGGGKFEVSGYASPSPDGTRLAFLTNRDISGGGLHVLDMATGVNTALNLAAATPRWSPNGDLIAYVAVPGWMGHLDQNQVFAFGELRVVRPDGTGARTVTKTASQFLPGIDWSPDGKYLIGLNNGGGLTVVEVATGEEVLVPLPQFKVLRAPDWRP